MAELFGAGQLFFTPTISTSGLAVTNPTPVNFANLQDISIDISSSEKPLYGQYQFPIATARGEAKCTGKAKIARISGSLFNVFLGQTITSGSQNIVVYQEAAIVPGTPFKVITKNNTTFLSDLGVTYTNNIALTRASSPSTIGQYSVDSTGGYTFNTLDATASVLISYVYTYTAANSNIITIQNQLMGQSPFFQMTLSGQYGGKNTVYTFNRVTSTKLSFATKLSDWTIPEIDFSMSVDDSGVLGTISNAE
jgi:hypothetical protein